MSFAESVLDTTPPTDRAEYLADVFSQMRAIRAERMENEDAGFNSAWEALGLVGAGNTMIAAQDPSNFSKNRYRNVLSYDHSRVILRNFPGGDYINANWIRGPNGRRYIACQAPIPESIGSFWWMVWQEKAVLIAMTTREVEGGQLKCHRYWPDPSSDPPIQGVTLGGINVLHKSTVNNEHFTTRKFQLSYKGEVREVTHLAYSSWPDHGIPLTTDEFLLYHTAFLNAIKGNENQPIIAHCSAGVGRTGTLIAIDWAIMELNMCSRDINIDHICARLRQARSYMVQTPMQFVFAFKAFTDYVMTKLAKAMDDVREEERSGKMKEAEVEYRKLEVEIKEEEKVMAEVTGVNTVVAQEQAAPPVQAKEIETASKTWAEQNRSFHVDYDVGRNLTSLQSRLESLNTKGIPVSQKIGDRQLSLVQEAKALKDMKKQKEVEAKEAEKAKKEKEKLEAEKAAAAAAEAQKKQEAAKGMDRFLRNVKVPK